MQGFKKIMIDRQDQFGAALTTKLPAYAVGRHAEAADRRHVEQVVKQLGERECEELSNRQSPPFLTTGVGCKVCATRLKASELFGVTAK